MKLQARGQDGLFGTIRDEAAQTVISKMEAWGSKLSDLHKETLRHVAGELVFSVCLEMPDSFRQRRQAIPLPVGAGKTQLFTAVLQALDNHDIEYSALICTSSLEEMGSCYNQLIQGSPKSDDIACMHSADNDTVKSYGLPESTEAPTRARILFVSHSRVENEDFLKRQLNTYKSNARTLVIWDEALAKVNSLHVSIESLIMALAPLQALARYKPSKKAKTTKILVDLVEDLTGRVMLAAEAGEQRTFTPIQLVNSSNRGALKAALKAVKDPRSRKVISDFLKLINAGFRLQTNKSGEVVMGYVMVIPPELQSVFILDASSTVSQLTALDKRINMMKGVEYDKVKRFSNCNLIQHTQFSASKDALNLRAKQKTHMQPILDEVVEQILDTPRDQAMLICTAKRRKGRSDDHSGFIAHLYEYLDANVKGWEDQTITHEGEELPRFNVIHWGQHRATSAYRHCSVILAIGVLRRRADELQATASGQLEDLEHPTLDQQGFIRYVQKCESFTCVQQLFGRGTARIIDNGQALPCTMHLWDNDNYREAYGPNDTREDLITRALPGIQYHNERGALGKVIDELVAVLEAQPRSVRKLSAVAWCKASPLFQELTYKDQMTLVRAEALRLLCGTWVNESRSVIRTN